VTTQNDKHNRACAAWQAKLERSLAEILDEGPDNYFETIQKFTAAAGPHQVVIEGDNSKGSGAVECIELVMLDLEFIALFEYDDVSEIGTDVNVLHIADAEGWEEYIGHYESRVFQLKDIKKLKSFHRNHLNVFKQRTGTREIGEER
jgi:hypothetical protein